MGLNYTDGCVNFRDVGEFINLILENNTVPEKLIFRGGSIDYIKDESEIESPKSIINLRNRADFNGFKADYFHFPMSNKIEKYDTSLKEVKIWLNQILKVFESPNLKYPVLIHCLSGKDRTGIVIAAILLIIGINQETIIAEYLLSEGEVKEDLILLALDGMRDTEKFFDKIDVEKIKHNLLNLKVKQVQTR